MYLKIKRGVLPKLINKAVKKAGSFRKLKKITGIPLISLSEYKREKRLINEKNLIKLERYLQETINEDQVIERLEDNFKQIIGGKKAVEKKRKLGTLNKQLSESRSKIKRTLRDWHSERKLEDPEKYHKSQYDKFKKVGKYKHKTKNGEKVRNILEKRTADLLKELGFIYQYEPLVKGKTRYFFPDFLVKNNVIIECTMWKGLDKAVKLKEKIKELEKYKVYVLIPEKLKEYYIAIKENLILGMEEFEKLAKTF